MNADATLANVSRIRTKLRIPVEIILNDGTAISGSVFIGTEERVQDLLNDAKTFFPVRMDNDEILLVNKASVALVKPLDVTRAG